MVLKICPNCNQQFTVTIFDTDFVHQCNSGDSSLDQEDVALLGKWEDYTGSGNVDAQFLKVAGTQNELSADARIRGEKFAGVTDRGNHKQLYRQRQKLHYITWEREDGKTNI